eukprot:GCRY01002077.1.p1 GENE.GCRY01002077.1~~GCRY01002077.1.p1  ORF type:complete len:403 (-),score=127.15 GCRY01002077.1:340-1548(-)
MDSNYLKSTVGETLSEALAQAAIIKPADPIAFVAHYLLKYNENVALQKKREEDAIQLEKERVEYAERMERERKMREEEERRLEFERKERERLEEEERLRVNAELLAEFQAKEQEAKAEFEEVLAEDPLEAYRLRLKSIHDDLMKLDKGKIAELLSYKVAKANVHRVIKAVFYMLGHGPKEVATWDDCRKLLRDPSLLKKIIKYDPTRVQKKKKFIRVAGATKGLSLKKVKASSFVAYIFFKWVEVSIQLRNEAVKRRKEENPDMEVTEIVLENTAEAEEEGEEEGGAEEGEEKPEEEEEEEESTIRPPSIQEEEEAQSEKKEPQEEAVERGAAEKEEEKEEEEEKEGEEPLPEENSAEEHPPPAQAADADEPVITPPQADSTENMEESVVQGTGNDADSADD